MKTIALIFSIILFLNVGITNAQSKSYDLKTFPKGKTPQEIGTRIAEKFLKTAHSRYGNTRPDTKPTQITYPDVCTWLGGMWFANITKNDDLFNRFESRFTPLFDTEKHLQPKPNHVDNDVFGSVPLELYLKTKQQKYLDLGLKYANSQWNLPEGAKPEEKFWADQGYSWQTRIWIDDMFMITAVQAQAYRATGDRKYIDRAATEMVLYLDKIQLENGLFYHSPEAHFSWGRGNGWMAVGMAEILRILPADNPNHKRILDGYHKMMAALLKYQEKDGMWRQIIDDPEAWKETSGTAMFTYAMITGVKNGWLDKKTYGIAARKGWLAVISYINADDELTEVCEGTNIKNDRNHYMQRKRIVGDLHGQAPVLWCATALLTTEFAGDTLFDVVEVIDNPVITKNNIGTEGNIFGFEGGRVLKQDGVYHIFTTEMYGEPVWCRTRIAHWKSKDGIAWTRYSTLFESSGNFTGSDSHAALWSPMPTFDEKQNCWIMTYVCYRSKPNTSEKWYRNYDGIIVLAESVIKGIKGIDGPYSEVTTLMNSDTSEPKLGLMGVDSFFPYEVNGQWLAFYGSSPEWNGLAKASSLHGPWKRSEEAGIVSQHTENPIVQKLKENLYIAFFDGCGVYQKFGYMLSSDGIHWSKPIIINLENHPDKWWGLTRTPLGLIDEGEGIYSLYFTAYNKNFYQIPGIWEAKTDAVFNGFFASVGMVKLKLRVEYSKP